MVSGCGKVEIERGDAALTEADAEGTVFLDLRRDGYYAA
jgi:hypothetical protein